MQAQAIRDAAEREQVERAARIHERTRTDALFLIDPARAPVLLDQSLGRGATARTEQELAWAESRLSDLGFLCVVDGTIKSYTYQQGSHIVFADPRRRGEIGFAVYKLPFPDPRTSAVAAWSFHIPDRWSLALRVKYYARVLDALRTLEPAARGRRAASQERRRDAKPWPR